MTSSRRLLTIVVATTAALLWGCGATPSSNAPTAASQPAASASEPTVSAAVAPPPRDPIPSEPLIDDGDPPGLDTLFGTTLVTVSDGIRVRSQPRVSDDSVKYEPLLPIGTSLYAFDGPVYASGYEWYQVASVSVRLEDPGCEPTAQWCRSIYTGWVARQGRDGEAWLQAGEPNCPPVPTDVDTVLAATAGARLACFPKVPITFEARLIPCNCDVDGGGYDPSWFGTGASPRLLVDPGVTRPPDAFADWLIADLDPAGAYPAVLPDGQVVEVTGMFDHPAAQACRYQGVPVETSGPPKPTTACRFMFATTAIRAVGS